MQPTVRPASGIRTAVLICARTLLLIGLIFTVDRAFAGGKVYRCGNLFQDQPCASTTSEATRPADKLVTRDAPTSVTNETTKAAAAARPAGANDRLVLDSPHAAVVEARR